MSGGNLLQVLYDRPADAPALVDAAGAVTSTSALRASVARCAAALAACGVGRQDRVSFQLDKGAHVVVLAHACLQLGAVLHPINSGYTAVETAALIADAGPALFVQAPGAAPLADLPPGLRCETMAADGSGSLDVLRAEAMPLLSVVPVTADETAALLYTSGTTGRPKGACITHGNLAASARSLAAVWALGPPDVLLHALPLYHAHGLLTAINSMMAGGGAILLLPGFDPAEVCAALPRATVIMGVPTHYVRLLERPEFGAAAAGLRLAISGSAPLSPRLAEAFEAASGRPLIERYGSTEAAIVAAAPPGTPRPGWVGPALPGVEVRVRLADGSRAERGATGQLETRGHNVFSGYWRRPDASAAALSEDGWFDMGDTAEIDDDGWIRLLGRSGDMIITGGLNVYPREVELALEALPEVAEVAVFGVPHPDFGETVVAAVRPADGMVPDEASLRAALRAGLAGYKLPKRIVTLAALPRNAMGKVLKSELKARFGGLFDAVGGAGDHDNHSTRETAKWT